MNKPMKICINLDGIENLPAEDAKRETEQYHKTMEQFYDAMSQPFALRGALMPDAHPGYALPIGGVVATNGVVVPAWVGYDIGCGVSATPFSTNKESLFDHLKEIHELIKHYVPVGFKHRVVPITWPAYDEIPKTEVITEQFENGDGFCQLGTLGGGNHFIEVGMGSDGQLWIVVHSGSRNIGHKTAQHYMRLAANSKKAKEGHYGFVNTSEYGQAYITDQNFCRQFARANRLQITLGVAAAIQESCEGLCSLHLNQMINRNHNHMVELDGMCIHRKGATQAEKDMLGVIPGNMRDGTFIVKGKGNEEFLWSSSHGAGRAYGRKEAKRLLSMDEFKNAMKGIVCDATEHHLDEAPDAYKDIIKVMEAQKDSVGIVHHIKPLINVKG